MSTPSPKPLPQKLPLLWWATLLAIGCSTLAYHLNLPFDLSIDGIQFVAFTKNLIEGHGPSRCNVNVFEMSTAYYSPIIAYPPGYLYLLAPLGWLGLDLFVANALMDSLGYFLYFLIGIRFLRLLNQDRRVQYTFAIVSLFTMVPLHYGNSSDLWALVLFEGAILQCLLLLKHSDKPRLLSYIITASLLLAAASIRFAYYPLIFIPPLVLMYMGWRVKESSWMKFGRNMLMILAVGLGLLSLGIRAQTGELAYTNKGFAIPDEQVAYPANLEKMDAFAPKALFDYSHLIAKHPYIDAVFPIWKPIVSLVKGKAGAWRILGLILSLLAMVYLAYRYLLTEKVYQADRSRILSQSFHFIHLLTAGGVIGLLVFLSLKDPHQKWGDWTYVQETRYYAPILAYLLICCLLWVFDRKTASILRASLWAFLGLSFLYGCSFWFMGMYRSTQIETKQAPLRYQIYETVKQVARENKTPVIYSGPSISEMLFVSVAGARPLMSLDSEGVFMANHLYNLINEPKLEVQEPVIVLVDIRDYVENQEEFIQRYQARKLLSYPDGGLYQLELGNP